MKNTKNKLSVFNYSYSKRYYLTHPWKLIKEFFQNCYHGWRRAIYGFTYEDVWNWDEWFLNILPPMFRHLADYGCAYPGVEPFETPEKWEDWLHSMADVIESVQEENFMEGHNEWEKLVEEREALIKDVYENLKKYHNYLWD